MLRNEVRKCSASGVFLRLSAHGLIAENNIHSNGEAGLDIRKGADPIILVNSSSVVACFFSELCWTFIFECISVGLPQIFHKFLSLYAVEHTKKTLCMELDC